MRLVLLSNIIYEVIQETADGKVTSKFFNTVSPLRSRQLALTNFLERVLSDELKPEEEVLTLYVRYLKTGQRFELLCSFNFPEPLENLNALEEELHLFQLENLSNQVAVYNISKPNLIYIVWATRRNIPLLKTTNTYVMLADSYSVFLRKKRELYRVA